MAALRPWPARSPSASRWAPTRYPLASGETFNAGDVVELDGSEDVAEVSGADPTPLLGIAAEVAADVVEAGFVMVYVFDGVNQMAIQGSSAPVKANINQVYGVIEDGDGIYTIDITDTTNTVFYVHDIDVNRELFFVTVLAADRQALA